MGGNEYAIVAYFFSPFQEKPGFTISFEERL